MADEDLLTMEEAIARLSTTRGTFYRWLRGGRIKGFKVGRQWRFRPAEIDRFLSGAEPSFDLPVSPKGLIEDLEKVLGDLPDLGDMDTDSVEYIVQLMLICGLKKGAASLFLDAVSGQTGSHGTFSLRIDGLVHEIATYDIRLHKPIIERVKQLGGMDVTETRKAQDGRIHFPLSADRSIDFVASVMPSLFGDCCSLMVRDPMVGKVNLEALGLSGVNLTRVRAALGTKRGLYIVSGPSESGKTVAAYALLNSIDKAGKRVMSIDEPGGISLEGVIQTIVEPSDMGIDEVIRTAARQNWDVLNINFIQQASTLNLAMHEALSGQVTTSMHLKDAISGLLTIREWGVEGLLLGEVLALIMNQRLVRRLCQECREPVTEMAEEDASFVRKVLDVHGQSSTEATYFNPVGCADCNEGYLGRIGLFETLVMTSPLEAAFLGGADRSELQRIALDEGMESLCLDGVRKAAEGITSLREVRRVVSDVVDTLVS